MLYIDNNNNNNKFIIISQVGSGEDSKYAVLLLPRAGKDVVSETRMKNHNSIEMYYIYRISNIPFVNPNYVILFDSRELI